MAKECKHHYYATMCGDGTGRRKGKYRSTRYASAIKGQKLTAPKKKVSKKTTKKTKKTSKKTKKGKR